jgi:glucuronoarabinoxylan endo-1,4-beta-xylanase
VNEIDVQTDSKQGCPSNKADLFKTVGAVFVCLIGVRAFASVTLTQNLGPNWVGSPTIMTANSPLTSKEGNWGTSAPYSLGQSFTAPVSGVLTNIQLYGSGKATANILLYLYDMGPALQYASQPGSVVSGSNSVTTVVSGNLFSTNLAITMWAAGPDSVMQLTFSGADAVQLIGGHEYMFAMVSTNSSPMYWDDSNTNPYSGGAAYQQNSLLDGDATRDFSLAVTLINTNAGPTIYNCVIDWTNVYQRIDGFGASSAWRSTWTTAQADMFFSTNSSTGTSIDGKTNFSFNGISLSLLRSRIVPGGGTWENSIMQMAQARGAKVWSAPWSPAPVAQFKTPADTNGGSFIGTTANYQAYASQLAGYVVNMTNVYGVNIYALSVQNEPDVSKPGSTGYESCLWTAQQIHDFVPYLSSALVASNVASTKIIIPEDEYWETNYYYTAMADTAVATNVGIVACHDYSGSPPNDIPTALPLYANTNAATWETETADLRQSPPPDGSMNSGIYWAGRIHLFMHGANVNAWHYWWLISNNADNEGLTDTNGVPAKRMYVLGQYSRFVRPGYYRIDEGNYNPYAVLASAYKDPVSGTFAIVIANTNIADTTQSFYFTNFTATTVTPWITSSDLSLAVQSAVTVTSSTFSYVIPGMSVVTFVGTALPNGPVLPVPVPVPDQTVNPGMTLLVTNAAVDANVPLTFTLLNGPTNATLTPLTATSALFSWTPLPSQANTTNLITWRVADNSTPSLSGTSSFNIIVSTNPPPSTNLFTFTLLNGPANSSLNPSNGVFTWRPPASQASTTNLITVAVTENFAPNLSATNSYNLIVNPLTPTVIGSFALSSGQASLTVNGTQGPDYTLLASTDLVNWQPLFTSNSPPMPLTLALPFSNTNPAQFYRIQISP